MGYIDNIEEKTLDNTNFRQVLFTGKHMQLVLMALKPGEEIGEEIHENVDQFFRIEQGEAKVIIDGEEDVLNDGMVAIVPAGAKHNVINTSNVDLKLYTIYSPPNHPDGTINKDKAAAEEYEKGLHQ